LNNLCIYSGGYCKAAVIEFLVGITGAVRFSGCARHGLAGDLVDGVLLLWWLSRKQKWRIEMRHLR
jgi:hypothetical protein